MMKPTKQDQDELKFLSDDLEKSIFILVVLIIAIISILILFFYYSIVI